VVAIWASQFPALRNRDSLMPGSLSGS